MEDCECGKLMKALFTSTDKWLDWITLVYYNMMSVDLNNLEKKATNWLKGWRPKKPKDTKTKKPKVIKKQKPLVNEKNNLNIDKEKEETKNKSKSNTLSKDKESKTFWDPDINECLKIIAWINWWIVDWKKWENRQYSGHLIKKIKKLEAVASWKYSREEYLSSLLQLVVQSKYDIRKITSPKKIYYELAALQQVANSIYKEWSKPKSKNLVSKVKL